MTQEEKELLLKDISARLPYGVKIQSYYEEMSGSGYFDEEVWVIDNDEPFHVNDRWLENVKPYLRPMSSMTEEENKEYKSFFSIGEYSCGGSFYGEEYEYICDSYDDVSQSVFLIDWLNKNMFDYRGLIDKGLALEALEGMYNTKQ